MAGTALLTTGTNQQPRGGVLTDATLTNIVTDLANLANGTANGVGSIVSGALANGAVGTAAIAAAAVTTALIDPQVIQYATVPLTLAQLLATNTAPVALLAAQGAGTLIEVLTMTLDLVRGSAAFANGGAVAAYLGTDSSGVLATTAIAATVFTTFPASQAIRVAGALAVSATSAILNKGLVLANPTADFITGTGATGIVKLSYRVHTGLA